MASVSSLYHHSSVPTGQCFQTSDSKALPFPSRGFDANVLGNKNADTLSPSQAESDFILQFHGLVSILIDQILRPCIFS